MRRFDVGRKMLLDVKLPERLAHAGVDRADRPLPARLHFLRAAERLAVEAEVLALERVVQIGGRRMDQMPAEICSPLVDRQSESSISFNRLKNSGWLDDEIVELADLGGLPIEVPIQIRRELGQFGDRVFVVIRLAIAELRRGLRAPRPAWFRSRAPCRPRRRQRRMRSPSRPSILATCSTYCLRICLK